MNQSIYYQTENKALTRIISCNKSELMGEPPTRFYTHSGKQGCPFFEEHAKARPKVHLSESLAARHRLRLIFPSSSMFRTPIVWPDLTGALIFSGISRFSVILPLLPFFTTTTALPANITGISVVTSSYPDNSCLKTFFFDAALSQLLKANQ